MESEASVVAKAAEERVAWAAIAANLINNDNVSLLVSLLPSVVEELADGMWMHG